MKICLLISAMNTGGAQRVAATLVNAWADRGDDVILMSTFSGSRGCFFELHPRVRLVYLADLVHGGGSLFTGAFARFFALRRFIAAEKPHVVISFLTSVNVAAILATRRLGIPIIVSERTDPIVEDETNFFWRALRKFTYPFADAVLVQTRGIVAEFVRQIPRMQITVVPNPLSGALATFATGSAKSSPTTRKRIVGMGRLESVKGFGSLIKAFHAIQGEFPSWDLWIFGEGSHRPELEGLVRQRGLGDRVFLPGTTSDPWRELARSDVFVLSSLYEGFPNVLLEAMALEVASVAFDSSGPRDITRGGEDALLIRSGDIAGLQDALIKLMSNDDLRRRLASAGAKSVWERFDLSVVLEQWDALLGRICGQTRQELSGRH
jgi:glycosyltransferase involved in cell wall biosynthesis